MPWKGDARNLIRSVFDDTSIGLRIQVFNARNHRIAYTMIASTNNP
jgi:hypothetical protein